MKLPILRVCIWPTAGSFHQHGNKTWRCMNERFNQSHSEREAAAGSATAGPELNFWQVESSKGPAGSLEDVQPWTGKNELISYGFNQFYGCLLWLHFFWKKSTGVKAPEQNSYEYKKGRCTNFIQGQNRSEEKEGKKLLGVLVYMFENWTWKSAAELESYHGCHFSYTKGTTLTKEKRTNFHKQQSIKQTQTWIAYNFPIRAFKAELSCQQLWQEEAVVND